MLRTTTFLLRRTVEECIKDNTPLLAAAIAFYTLLSLAPALWVLLAIAGAVFGQDSARAEIVSMVQQITGVRVARVVDGVLSSIAAKSLIATTLGFASILFGATIAFSALQESLNRIWNVPPPDRGAIRDFLIKRLVSFAVVLLVGVLLLASLTFGTIVSGVARFVPQYLPVPQIVLQILDFAGSMVVMTALFAVIYRILPDARIHWRDVLTGAAVTALLFTIGKTAISLYLGYAGLGSVYGAAGSLLVFLVWVYYSAQIFLFGAEFTEVYARESPWARSAG